MDQLGLTYLTTDQFPLPAVLKIQIGFVGSLFKVDPLCLNLGDDTARTMSNDLNHSAKNAVMSKYIHLGYLHGNMHNTVRQNYS